MILYAKFPKPVDKLWMNLYECILGKKGDWFCNLDLIS